MFVVYFSRRYLRTVQYREVAVGKSCKNAGRSRINYIEGFRHTQSPPLNSLHHVAQGLSATVLKIVSRYWLLDCEAHSITAAQHNTVR